MGLRLRQAFHSRANVVLAQIRPRIRERPRWKYSRLQTVPEMMGHTGWTASAPKGRLPRINVWPHACLVCWLFLMVELRQSVVAYLNYNAPKWGLCLIMGQVEEILPMLLEHYPRDIDGSVL